MHSHEIDYKIIGNDIQAVEIELDPGEVVIAEAGSMNWFEQGIEFESKMGDGSKFNEGFFSRAINASKRVVTGESFFLTHFENKSNIKRTLAFAAPFPGNIVPLDLSEVENNQIICQRDSFLCAALGTKIDLEFTQRFGAGFFGGEGFVLQKISGDGKAFIHAGGSITRRKINNESFYIDTGCLVAFSGDLRYSIKRAGNIKSMLFGGEGLFLVELKGTGHVYVQTLPFARLADRIIAQIPKPEKS